jgi:hypothetical protein
MWDVMIWMAAVMVDGDGNGGSGRDDNDENNKTVKMAGKQ